MTTTDKKYMVYIFLALAIAFVAWLLFVKKPKIVGKAVALVTGKKTPEQIWKEATSFEIADKLTWNGKQQDVKVKNYNGADHALLQDGTVLKWVNVEHGFTAPGYWQPVNQKS